MSIYKRGGVYWIRITHHGRRIQKSAGTACKQQAQELHDKIKSDLWRQEALNECPDMTWNDAMAKWIKESQHKRSIKSDICTFRWLYNHLNGLLLKDLNKKKIEELTAKRELNSSPATVNRMLALVRAVLRKAEREWEWIERAPSIKMKKEDNKRIRQLSQKEIDMLVPYLPMHTVEGMNFTLQTGLRESNVTQLKWEYIDLNAGHAYIPASSSKSGKAIAIPLNKIALEILERQKGKHAVVVFTFAGKAVRRFNTRAWKNALKKAGLTGVRWHDLRHTWASRHVQNGTPLHELQQLGGWSSFDLVLRYAHLSSNHLKQAAERLENVA
jgi:integrase